MKHFLHSFSYQTSKKTTADESVPGCSFPHGTDKRALAEEQTALSTYFLCYRCHTYKTACSSSEVYLAQKS
jgi:hypothetical protein